MGNIKLFRNLIGAYSETCQTSKMEFTAKIVNGFQPLVQVKRSKSSKLALNK